MNGLLQHVFIRYMGASGAATLVDLSLFMLLLGAGMLPAVAAALGYCGGVLMHWLISSRAVFAQGLAPRGGRRNVQKTLFIASGLAGLGLTTLIVGVGDGLDLDPRLAKLAAMAVSFVVTYLLRRHVVFGRQSLSAPRVLPVRREPG